MVTSERSGANRLLGYPADARLLMINCDDLGMHAGTNAGVAQALAAGVARSASLMVPCSGAAEAMDWLATHPEVRFGAHITLVRDRATDRWPPLSPAQAIPLLLGGDDQFALHDGTHRLQASVSLAEVERETRAQIDAVLSAGLRPTHLDWHCLLNGGRQDVFEFTLGLAREYGLALRVAGAASIARVQGMGLPCADHEFLDSFSIPTGHKPTRYLELLRTLPAGLSEWALHPSTGDAPPGADAEDLSVRRTDLAFLTSDAARETIAREGITLLDYRELEAVWQGATD